MGKSKEEDKIEKLIRSLLKLPENKRCINCNSLGPQYVCTTFWTFVCTNCSGVHREFTHRVKSISMAKFSMEEVNSLQAGGNEKAREIYFKTWNPHRNILPDNSNIHKLREFIKHVYVDKRYTGESHVALVPRLRYSDKDEQYERRRPSYTGENSANRDRSSMDRYSRYSNDEVRSPGYPREDRIYRYANDEGRNPGYRDAIERYMRSSEEVRSPGYYPRESNRYGGMRASSSHFDGSEGRYQVDDARIAGRSATQMFTTEDIKVRRKSPDRRWSRDVNSPPPVRNVRELLGENFMALRVGDQAKRSPRASINAQVVDRSGQNSPREAGDHSRSAHRRTVSANVQGTVQSSSQVSGDNESPKLKSGSVGSLVNFASFPPPLDSSTQNQEQKHVSTVTDEGNSASSEPSFKETASTAPKNTLEFLLFELSGPAESTPLDQSQPSLDDKVSSNAPLCTSGTLNNVPELPNDGASEPSSLALALTFPGAGEDFSHGALAEALPSTPSASALTAPPTRLDTVSSSFPQSNYVEEPSTAALPMTPDLLGDDNVSSTVKNQYSSTLQPYSNQQANFYPTASTEVSSTNSTIQPTQPAEIQTQETKPTTKVQQSPHPADTKPTGRAELPADLFASLYPPRPMPAPAWQMSPGYGMGFNMQYYPNHPMQTAPFSNVSKSINPFDTNDNTSQIQPTMFSSVAAIQGGLPNVSAPAGMLHTPSFGSHPQGFGSVNSPSHQSGAYNIGHYNITTMPPSSQQEVGGFSGGAMPTSLNSNQEFPHKYPASAEQSSFPTSGGNPFG